MIVVLIKVFCLNKLIVVDFDGVIILGEVIFLVVRFLGLIEVLVVVFGYFSEV